MAVRKDTLTLTFERASGRPSNLELSSWLKNELSVTVSDLLCVEPEVGTLCTHLLFKDGSRVQRIVEEGEERSLTYASGRQGKVLLSTSGVGFKVVRVRRLPATVSDDDVMLFLNLYGKVQNVVKEKWPRGSVFEGLWTGARLVKMVVKENIPSFRTIAGAEAFIDYPGQLRTCQLCAATDHMKINCPKRGERISYASRLARRNGPETPVVDDEHVFFDGRKREGSTVSLNEKEKTAGGKGDKSDGEEKGEEGETETQEESSRDEDSYDFSIFSDIEERGKKMIDSLSIPPSERDIAQQLALLREACDTMAATSNDSNSTADDKPADDKPADDKPAAPAKQIRCFVNASGLGGEEEFPPLPNFSSPLPPPTAAAPVESQLAASLDCAAVTEQPALAATPAQASSSKGSLLPLAKKMMNSMEKNNTTKLASNLTAANLARNQKRLRENSMEQIPKHKKRGGKKQSPSTANSK